MTTKEPNIDEYNVQKNVTTKFTIAPPKSYPSGYFSLFRDSRGSQGAPAGGAIASRPLLREAAKRGRNNKKDIRFPRVHLIAIVQIEREALL
jgi:hypothetical protein